MTANDRLREAGKLYSEIVQLTEMLGAAYQAATSTSSPISDMPHAPSKGRADERLVEYANLSLELDGQLETRRSELNEVFSAIGQIADSDLRQILYAYYFQGKTDEQIGEQLDYERSVINRKRAQAVIAFERILQ
jgi:hypothetical protein